MANRVLHCSATFMDQEGSESQVGFYLVVVDTLTVAEIDDAVNARVVMLGTITNASRVQVRWSAKAFTSKVPPTPVAAHFISAEDKAFMTFTTDRGFTLKMSMPAPIDDIFMGDQETLDPFSTQMAAFLADWVADGPVSGEKVCDNDGDEIKEYNYGYRTRPRNRSEKPGRYQAVG